MKNIETSIVIDAPIQKVWEVLMDFDAYPNWNSFIHPSGKAEVGSRLENKIFLEGMKPQVFKPKVLEVKATQKFRWEGNLFIRGLFDGEHYFHLEKLNKNQTKLIHGENFRGILVRLILRMIEEKTVDGFKRMNTELKQHCEATEPNPINE